MTTQAQGAFAERAIGDGGLEAVLAARRAGRDLTAFQSLVLGADILALGALADGIRAEEVGEVVRITVRDAEAVDARAADVVPMPDASPDARGLLYLRAVAAARILGPKAAPVVADWTVPGLELAQLALSVGAPALAGPIVWKRGLPIAKHDPQRAKRPGMRRYSINFIDREKSPNLPYDGFSELWFDSEDDLKAAIASPAGQTLMADLPNFTDRIEPALVTEHPILWP